MDTRSSLPKLLSGARQCVYCGQEADTVDHSPSRCLLRKPLPSNLITLPACQNCNHGFSFHESIVHTLLTLVSSEPDLVAERQSGGRLHRALQRDAKLRKVLHQSLQPDGNYLLDGEILTAFQRVFRKAVQGLFFAMYQRLVPAELVNLIKVLNCGSETRDQVILELGPNPLEEITDQPFSAITPKSWHTRQPIFFLDLKRVEGGEPVRRVFRLKRETITEWIRFQPGILEFAFVEREDDGIACVLDLWKTLVVVVAAPWPNNRGPLRRGRKNPFSRDALLTKSY